MSAQDLAEQSFTLQLVYLGKHISYRFKDPILDAAYGVKKAVVIGVLVTLPGLDDTTELMISTPNEEPDFISTKNVDILSLSEDPPLQAKAS